MSSCLIMIENPQEKKILNTGLYQTGVDVILSKADYKNYTLAMQYQPDFLLMELPATNTEQLYIANCIKKHPRFKSLPIIGYGDKVKETERQRFLTGGISMYMERPLKFSLLLENIETLLKPQMKTLSFAGAKSEDKKKVDMAKIMSPDTPPGEKIDLMVSYITRLMAFPFTIAKVLQITQDDKSGAGHIAKVISSDPAISANILKVSNSVYFVCSDRRISSIKEAIVRIGFSETKNIVIGMMVPKLLNEALKNLGFDRQDFWQHSLAAALFADKIARFIGGTLNSEMAFLAGLLHDLGVVILDEFFPDFFASSLKETSIRASHFPDEQTARFGINHKDVVARLFPEWKIPADITEAVVNHTDFVSFKTKSDSLSKKLTYCVMLGNILAKVAHFGRECDQFVWPVENWVFEQLHVGNVITANFIDDIHRAIVQYSSFLSLERREYSSFIKTADAQSTVLGIINSADHMFIPIEMYLLCKGYKVERVTSLEDAEEGSLSRFSMIFVWAGSVALTMEALAPYIAASKNAKNEDGTEKKAPPFLLMVDPAFKNAGLFPDNISIMGNRFDLRELELTMEKILSGMPVRTIAAAEAVEVKKGEG
jgi:putative nucleotidyltransferase with HDIG domain